VVRQALIASSFGIRFQGHGYFLTDARAHRGTSGAGNRDAVQDESLGLSCAWYADILLTLTASQGRSSGEAA
jgi:hypothetical protein